MIRSPTPLLNTKLKELPKNTTKRDLTVTGRLVNDFGASETVQLALVAPGADGSEGGAVDHWRKRVSPRLNMDRARDALETTEQIGAQLLTPDDSKWPEEMNILGDHAPLALWVLGNAEHLSAEASVGSLARGQRPVMARMWLGSLPMVSLSRVRSWCRAALMASMLSRIVPR